MSVLLHVCRNYEQKDQNNNKKTISILFWECLWMIFCDPLESGSLQSDSNQIRTAVSTVLSPLAHTKHHSCVNGTRIVMATCHWASCRTELPETEKTPSQLKTIRIWKILHVIQCQSTGALTILSGYPERKDNVSILQFFSLSLPLSQPNTIPYDPGESGTRWYGMCFMLKNSVGLKYSMCRE